jgi:Transglycosylase SLT domain
VRVPILLWIAGFSSIMSLAAQEDPFAPYHKAIEDRLVGMSEAGGAPPRKPIEIPALSERKIAPAITIADFALRFWGGRDAEVSAAVSRLQRYRPTVEHILEQEGIPKGLVAVVLIESGAQLLAASPKQARGLWQFIPATARQYGLTVTSAKDERVHVEQSTKAAARYLHDLYKRFGDWPLALAAYNAGAEAVQRALQRGHASTFSQISAARLLPEETRNYVPAVLSAIELLGADGLVEPRLAVKEQSARILYAPAAVTN